MRVGVVNLGATRPDALTAMSNGDPVAIGAVIADGVPRFVGRSRNTPPTTRPVTVARCEVPAVEPSQPAFCTEGP